MVRKLHGPTENAVAPDSKPQVTMDAGDPDARADFFQDDVARHFEQEVAQKKAPAAIP
jgi:hypothetical protein